MERHETRTLFGQGKQVWNAWANELLAKKKKWQEDGTWESEKQRWIEEATANFYQHRFDATANFRGFVFPGPANFERAFFANSALFHNTAFCDDAWFCHTIIKGDVEFHSSHFAGRAIFDNANFQIDVAFEGVEFCNSSSFKFATFSGNTWFYGATFAKGGTFNGATFVGSAEFTCAEFIKKANFYDATFHQNAIFTSTIFSDYVTFSESTFSSNTWFKNTKFSGNSNFKAVDSVRYFSLDGARFEQVPDFTQAHFLEAPSLDRIVIGPEAQENPTPPASQSPSPLRGGIEGGGGSSQKEFEEIPARWRHLRRLATQGHDHKNEQYFFAEEIRSRRKVFDFLLGKNWQRYWAGQVYQKLSDFGRSIWRPIWIWIGTTLAYAATLFLAHNYISTLSPPLGRDGCMLGNSDPITTALKVALDNALLLPVFGVSDGRAQEYLCLFGHDISLKTPVLPPVPLVPWWISGLGTFHTVFSAILIFLTLLAIRNQFRIR